MNPGYMALGLFIVWFGGLFTGYVIVVRQTARYFEFQLARLEKERKRAAVADLYPKRDQ